MKGKIFNAQEVQSIIAGNKTQFREVIKPQPLPFLNDNDYLEFLCPYQVGQKIFCKERLFNDGDQFFYDDEDGTILDKKDEKFWKRNCSKRVIPAKNCPEWASRLTLQIKDIRVERLSEISEEDAIAEAPQYSIIQPFGNKCSIDFFKTLWNYTHKKPEEKFEASPFVFVYQFELIK